MSSALGWSRRSGHEVETQHPPPSCSHHQQNVQGACFLTHPCPREATSAEVSGSPRAPGCPRGGTGTPRRQWAQCRGWGGGGTATGWEDDQWLRRPIQQENHVPQAQSLEDHLLGVKRHSSLPFLAPPILGPERQQMNERGGSQPTTALLRSSDRHPTLTEPLLSQ